MGWEAVGRPCRCGVAALVGGVDVAQGGAQVGVASEVADDVDVHLGFGQALAERVAQDVGGGELRWQAGLANARLIDTSESEAP